MPFLQKHRTHASSSSSSSCSEASLDDFVEISSSDTLPDTLKVLDRPPTARQPSPLRGLIVHRSPRSSSDSERDFEPIPPRNKVGFATVTYSARKHRLSVKYCLEIYAPLDRVWLVALDSIYDTWHPVQRYQATNEAVHTPVRRPPTSGLHPYSTRVCNPLLLDVTPLPLHRRDAQAIKQRQTTIIYGSNMSSTQFKAQTRQMIYDAGRHRPPTLDEGRNSDDSEDGTGDPITCYVIEDTYEGELMETHLRQALGKTHPMWEEELKWQADIVQSVKCIARDVKRRCERNFEVHVL